ncbi:MAG: hypothetical protein HFF50_06580 [Lawsonibacter sp.]|nr:hypothetical protein [Lawsonibacter sp.]
MISGIVFLAILVVGVVLIVGYLRAWNKSQSSRQAQAETQRQRHGGQAVLEWNGPKARGEGDPEFGELLVEIPKKSGKGKVCFYLRGVVVDGKRMPYDSLKDVAFAERTPSLIQTPKNAAVMWLYPKKGMGRPVSIFSLHYQFEDSTMKAIQVGLGFGQR